MTKDQFINSYSNLERAENERPDFYKMNDKQQRDILKEIAGRRLLEDNQIYQQLFGEDVDITYVKSKKMQYEGIDVSINKGEEFIDEKCVLGNGRYESDITLELKIKGYPTQSTKKRTTYQLYINVLNEQNKAIITIWSYDRILKLAKMKLQHYNELYKKHYGIGEPMTDEEKREWTEEYRTSREGSSLYTFIPLSEADKTFEIPLRCIVETN